MSGLRRMVGSLKPPSRWALAVLVALALVVTVAGCGPTSSSGASTATATATYEVIRDLSTPCVPALGAKPWQFDGSVGWSPDGSVIVFTDGGPWVYAAAADGSRLWQIMGPGGLRGDGVYRGTMTAFAIAPDSAGIVYGSCEYRQDARQRNGEGLDSAYDELELTFELTHVQLDGTDPRRLTDNEYFDSYPAWSPDGTRIAFLSTRDALDYEEAALQVRLYTMAADGSDVRSLSAGDGRLAHHLPQWSPDGRRLAFVGGDDAAGKAIYAVGTAGSDPRWLSAAVSGPSWSPDGERIAFAKPEQTEVALFTVAADGSDAQRVTTIDGWRRQCGAPDPTRARIQTVAWSPAGEHILYTCGRTVCVVEADGTPVGRSPIDLRDDRSRLVAAWSPDGARIAITDSRVLSEDIVLYTMAPDGTDLRILVRRDADAGLQALGARRPAGLVDVAGCAAGAAVPDPAANPGLVRRRYVHAQQIEAKLGDRVSGQREVRHVACRDDPRDEVVIAGGLLHRLLAAAVASQA